MVDLFQDYVHRGIVDTDLATFENWYTKEQPLKVIERHADDGRVDIGRRYATDAMPGASHVYAIGKLPPDFGDYGNGLIVLLLTSGWSDSTVVQETGSHNESGTVPSPVAPYTDEQTSGYWPTVFQGGASSAWHVLVHKPVRSPYEYATNWVEIEGAGSGIQRPTFGTYSYPYSAAYNGLPIPETAYSGGGQYGHYASGLDGVPAHNNLHGGDEATIFPRIHGQAKFLCQRIGNTVLLIANGSTSETTSGPNGPQVIQIGSDLSVKKSTTNFNDGAFKMMNPVGAFGFFGPTFDAFITEDEDPFIFVYGRGQVWNFPLSSLEFDGVTPTGAGVGECVPGWPATFFVGETPTVSAVGSGYKGATFQWIGPETTSHNGVITVKEYDGMWNNGHVLPAFVKPWSSGDQGAPEMWFAVCITRPTLDASVGDNAYDVSTEPTTRTYDLYRSAYTSGEFKPTSAGAGTPLSGQAYGDDYGAPGQDNYPQWEPGVGLNKTFLLPYMSNDDYSNYKYCVAPEFDPITGDPATATGVNEYPTLNPKGYAFEYDFFKPANKVGSFSLPGAAQVSQAVRRSFLGGGQTVPGYQYDNSMLNIQIWRGAGGGVLHMLAVDMNFVHGFFIPFVFNDPYTGWFTGNATKCSLMWIGTSSDDGKTWQMAAPKTYPRPSGYYQGIPGEPDSVNYNAPPTDPNGLVKREWVQLGGSSWPSLYTEQSWLGAATIDGNGNFLWPIDHYWQYFKPGAQNTTQGAIKLDRYRYFNRDVTDQGHHVGLWFMGEAIGIGTSEGGPSTILFSRGKSVAH